MPIVMVPVKNVVKLVEETRDNDAHFRVSQILADTIARSVAEGFEHGVVVPFKLAVVTWVCGWQPSFGTEGVRVNEVFRVAEGRPLVCADESLFDVSQGQRTK